ncbi:hypothetical protein WN51_00788 [Melipona quadrifasciata]|uniref:Uncharacterized protein n=1 Tax=Melipona quadrifasciata TaxID=166423 RepID=A0A0N0BFB6_9HYME|nr:hypothetical protein WN51_00788 [Melipona quadrifasciata]
MSEDSERDRGAEVESGLFQRIYPISAVSGSQRRDKPPWGSLSYCPVFIYCYGGTWGYSLEFEKLKWNDDVVVDCIISNTINGLGIVSSQSNGLTPPFARHQYQVSFELQHPSLKLQKEEVAKLLATMSSQMGQRVDLQSDKLSSSCQIGSSRVRWVGLKTRTNLGVKAVNLIKKTKKRGGGKEEVAVVGGWKVSTTFEIAFLDGLLGDFLWIFVTSIQK